MCRIFGYVGPPMHLSQPLLEAPHSLKEQSRDAREMDGSNIAGDGWGVGWFPKEASVPPGLLKSILPLWSDENAKSVGSAIVSRSMIGHIRHASEGVEVCLTNTPVFLLDDFLFTMNGELQPWPGELSPAVRSRLADDVEAAVRGSTDAEMLAALWRTHMRQQKDADAGEALIDALHEAAELAVAHGGSIKANVILANRSGLVAARFGEPDESSSLYYLADQERWNNGIVIASEPMDSGPGWHKMKPSTLVRASVKDAALERSEIGKSRQKASA
jgi:gamma-glutamyl hercynylcysteine S-oxide hydrolase